MLVLSEWAQTVYSLPPFNCQTLFSPMFRRTIECWSIHNFKPMPCCTAVLYLFICNYHTQSPVCMLVKRNIKNAQKKYSNKKPRLNDILFRHIDKQTHAHRGRQLAFRDWVLSIPSPPHRLLPFPLPTPPPSAFCSRNSFISGQNTLSCPEATIGEQWYQSTLISSLAFFFLRGEKEQDIGRDVWLFQRNVANQNLSSRWKVLLINLINLGAKWSEKHVEKKGARKYLIQF